MRQWRLIDDQPASGVRNMAVDEAILIAVGAGESAPTLRLYDWTPPCLSLGYGQHAAEVDRDRLVALGWGLVRRPTGGRAILHTDELTYSVALPAEHPLASGDIVESYRRISAALMLALGELGAQPRSDRAEGRVGGKGPVCFETPSHYEITVGGRKLVGSAQVRRHQGVLQHGTLPLTGDVARICDALVYDDEAAREQARMLVRARALTLEQALDDGRAPTWREAADAVVRGFQAAFDIRFEPGSLTTEEAERAEALAAQTYARDQYTFYR